MRQKSRLELQELVYFRLGYRPFFVLNARIGDSRKQTRSARCQLTKIFPIRYLSDLCVGMLDLSKIF